MYDEYDDYDDDYYDEDWFEDDDFEDELDPDYDVFLPDPYELGPNPLDMPSYGS